MDWKFCSKKSHSKAEKAYQCSEIERFADLYLKNKKIDQWLHVNLSRYLVVHPLSIPEAVAQSTTGDPPSGDMILKFTVAWDLNLEYPLGSFVV